jgi:hypothetical protein
MGGHVASMRERRNAYSILIGKPEWSRPLGRPGPKLEDNIGTNLRKMVWEGVVRMNMVQDGDQWRAFVNTVMNIRVPFLEYLSHY